MKKYRLFRVDTFDYPSGKTHTTYYLQEWRETGIFRWKHFAWKSVKGFIDYDGFEVSRGDLRGDKDWAVRISKYLNIPVPKKADVLKEMI